MFFGAALGLFHYYEYGRFSEKELIYAKPAQQITVGADDLAYLNLLRTQAGLSALAQSQTLERSARNHARYLLSDPNDGHDERNRHNPFFTGRTPFERAVHAGYLYQGVHENLTTGSREEGYGEGNILQRRRYLDGLMTAIYHRFSLLAQDIDEAGVAFEKQNGREAMVVNQGNAKFNRACALGRVFPESGRSFYRNVCANRALVYPDEVQSARRESLYIAYPQGGYAMPEFYKEDPDPMPDYEFTGNPVSIDFSEHAGKIDMLSFNLYQDGRKINKTRILDKNNDPNRRFTAYQFALFPLEPLQYDTRYHAVFEYKRNGIAAKAEWHFTTQKPDYPYFFVNGGEKAAVRSGEKYFVHWQDFWCLSECERYTFRSGGNARLDIVERRAGGLVLKVSGSRGSYVELSPEGQKDRKIVFYVTDKAV